jgi:hypothetical protein
MIKTATRRPNFYDLGVCGYANMLAHGCACLNYVDKLHRRGITAHGKELHSGQHCAACVSYLVCRYASHDGGRKREGCASLQVVLTSAQPMVFPSH